MFSSSSNSKSLLERLAISEKAVNQVLDILKKGHDDIQLYYRTAISETRGKIDNLNKKMDILYDDRLEGRITTPDYDKYVTRYKAEKEELEYKLVEYSNNDKSFVLTAVSVRTSPKRPEYLSEFAIRPKEQNLEGSTCERPNRPKRASTQSVEAL